MDAAGNEYKLIAKRDDDGSELILMEDGREAKHIRRGVYDLQVGSATVRVQSEDEFAP
jgi:hypothetical protein